ncbi:hypothetical protein [Streptomyces sp. NPDC049879]|uniref:hypothetical protein n=1 Tax=Streptomyces sp. NPDC049879 TaxID=3365598 RepID=UPI0037B5ACD2
MTHHPQPYESPYDPFAADLYDPYDSITQEHTLLPLPIAPAAVATAAERRIAWVPDAFGRMVPMPRDFTPPMPARTEPRDLTPAPIIDPRAQILIGGGLGASATGWGIGQMLSALAGVSGGLLLGVALLLIAAKLPRRTGQGDTHITHVTSHGLFSRANSTINHR